MAEIASSERAPNFYWVKDGPGWAAAAWTGRHWLVCGTSEHFQDKDFDEIGEVILTPGELPDGYSLYRNADAPGYWFVNRPGNRGGAGYASKEEAVAAAIADAET